MKSDVTFHLSEKDQQQLAVEIGRIRPADEMQVRTQFAEKFEHLEERLSQSRWVPDFVIDLMSDVKYLYEMLADDSYALSPDVKAKIVFALGYFISPIDMVPDTTPLVGYLDDAVVVASVCADLRQEIERYRQHSGQ